MLFIEASTFSKLLPKYLTDEEYRALQSLLMQRPEAGAVIKGSGGVRKVRWAPSGSGKSGGVRVIYYWGVLTFHIGSHKKPHAKANMLSSFRLSLSYRVAMARSSA